VTLIIRVDQLEEKGQLESDTSVLVEIYMSWFSKIHVSLQVQSVDEAPVQSFGLFKRRSVEPTHVASATFEALGLVKRVSEVR
jgi:hypothetical protein